MYKPDEILEEIWDIYMNLYAKHETMNIEESSFKGIEEKLPKQKKMRKTT